MVSCGHHPSCKTFIGSKQKGGMNFQYTGYSKNQIKGRFCHSALNVTNCSRGNITQLCQTCLGKICQPSVTLEICYKILLSVALYGTLQPLYWNKGGMKCTILTVVPDARGILLRRIRQAWNKGRGQHWSEKCRNCRRCVFGHAGQNHVQGGEIADVWQKEDLTLGHEPCKIGIPLDFRAPFHAFTPFFCGYTQFFGVEAGVMTDNPLRPKDFCPAKSPSHCKSKIPTHQGMLLLGL